jgi:hypothetical protein
VLFVLPPLLVFPQVWVSPVTFVSKANAVAVALQQILAPVILVVLVMSSVLMLPPQTARVPAQLPSVACQLVLRPRGLDVCLLLS